MHIVGWEGRRILALVHRLGFHAIGYSDLLKHSFDEEFGAHELVRLHTWHAKWANPLDGFTCSSDDLRALCEPVFDLVGISKQVTNALDGHSCEVLCCSVQFCVGLEELTVLQLPLDLLSGSNKSYTVDRGHDCLLDDFTGDLALQTLSDLDQGRVFFILDIADDVLEDGRVNVTRPF